MLRTNISLSLFIVVGLLLGLLSEGNLFAISTYDIQVAGFTDAEHTRDDGYIISCAYSLNESGQVVGVSLRYSGSADMGCSAWLYDQGVTIRLGLSDPEYTRDDGYKYSFAYPLNESGQVVGSSNRYSGSISMGRSAWIYDHGVTTKLGLTDPEYTRDDGYKDSYAYLLNKLGQVVGASLRYSGNTDMGQSAWINDQGVITHIGLTDPEYTRNDGYKYSMADGLNEAGQVLGHSLRYSGGTDMGQSVWIYDHGAIVRLGFADAEHTRNDGYQTSYTSSFNEAGQVLGSSLRYIGGTDMGQSAWLYDHGVTTRLGLTDAEYIRDDGYKLSLADSLNKAGQVIGYSERYSGSTDMGRSAWLYDHGVTTRLGFKDAEYNLNNGKVFSIANSLNEAGQIIGLSLGINSRSAWIYDHGVTTRLGLIDAGHTRDDGFKQSDANALNEAGQVIGYSERYSGSIGMGRSGWFFDNDMKKTFPLVFSTRPDGYAHTDPEYLSNDGTVLGSYEVFGSDGTDLGDHVFMWSISDGFHELGLLVDGGLTGNGWEQLYSAANMNGHGDIVGAGTLISQSGGQVVFVMSPVPEPSTLVLLFGAMGALAILARLGLLNK